jgi:glycosyltransferase involved in cell wall biosynthesis
LILSHWFSPEPVPKLLELAVALRKAGDGVEVVTGYPNYPDGKLYPGYRVRLMDREMVDGVQVRRMFMYPDHGQGLLGRLLNFASFMVSGFVGGLFAATFDVMYVFHPPPSAGLAAAAIGWIRGRGFVYDVQDIWPDSAIASGFLRPGRFTRWMSVVERFVYRCADHILVGTDGAKSNLISKGVPGEKITVAPHWYDDSDWRLTGQVAREELRAREGWDGRFVVMFAGNLGMMQGLDTVVHACSHLPAQVQVVFVGDGVDKARLVALTTELGVEDRVQFIERQPFAAMSAFFAAADALLVHLRASPTGELVIPSKTIAYLAAGKPIIMANAGASADLVKQAEAGVVLAPDDPRGLATAIADLLGTPAAQRDEMGKKGREFFEQHFTQEATLPIYREALARSASRGTA